MKHIELKVDTAKTNMNTLFELAGFAPETCQVTSMKIVEGGITLQIQGKLQSTLKQTTRQVTVKQ